jgi:ABC-type multidrug transport system fused ATPase/permease subunit
MNLEHYLATFPGLFGICLLAPVSFAITGNFLARKWIEPQKRNPHHAIAHATLGPIATIFGVLGAFIVATTWNEYTTTRVNLNEESNALRDLYFNAQAFTPTICNKIQQYCRDYRKTVLEHEWKIVVKSKDDVIGDEIIKELANIYLNYSLNNDKEKIYFQLSVENLEKLRKYREQRIQDSSIGLEPLLWILFLLGATTLILVSILMISSPGNTHGAMSVLLSALIGIMIFAIISLDFPFIGITELSTMPLDMIPMDQPAESVQK